MSLRLVVSCAVSAVIGGLGLATLRAQQGVPGGAKQDVVLKQDMTIPGREVLMVEVELPPGFEEGRHTHPAEVFGFVVSGTIESEIEGKITTLKAGDHFYFAPGQVHQNMNKSSAPATTYVVFVAEKGKPLRTNVK
jgi:quercetin dioxygenase-like cupin family protein